MEGPRPHSKHSPHNFRTVKVGPRRKSQNFLDKSIHSPKLPPPKNVKSTGFGSLNRPIATNSRIEKDGIQRKDMFAVFVNDALTSHAFGDSESFNQLVSQFNFTDIKPESSIPVQSQLRLWLSALSQVVSRLERIHAPLIQAIADLSWTSLESATVKSYTIFVGMLLSARPEYLALFLEKIAQGFTFQPLPLSSHTLFIPRRTIFDRQHYLLQHLLSVIPTLSTTLLPLLSQNFPHKRQKEAHHTIYIRNILQVGAYCPEISDKILALIVDRAVRIDVEIQIESEDLEDALDQQELFELDLFDTMMDQEDESSSDESGGEEDEGFSDISSEEEGDVPDTRAELEAAKAQTFTDAKHIHEMGKKLDAVLLLVFEHFSQVHQRTTGASVHVKKEDPNLPTLPPLPPLPGITTFTDIPDPPTPSTKHQDPLSLAPVPTIESADGLHPQHFTLLSLFERLLLPTFKSRYTQFLLFHSASLSPAFADLFLGLLLERALYQETVPAVTRVAATSYIASFVSRAKFIQQDTAREVVGVLCEYLSNSIVAVETGTGTIGGQDTPTFYAVVQAVFVIFCFRWQDLQDGDEDQKHWMKELGIMQRVLDSVLDPLKWCANNVVQQFARVAHNVNFVYCYSHLQAQNRKSSPSQEQRSVISGPSAPGHSLQELTMHLNTFFPFDPYSLPKSRKYIVDAYRDWSEVDPGSDEEEEEEEEEEDEGDLGEGENSRGAVYKSTAEDGQLPPGRAIPKPSSKEDADFEVSLDAMSISPQHHRPAD